MKTTKYVLLLFVVVLSFGSCKESVKKETEKIAYQCPMKCEGEKTYHKEGKCPVCNMKLRPISATTKVLVDATTISENSIFNLTTTWNTQDAKSIELKELKGKALVMVMIYTTCKAACPRLVADMRNIAKEIPEEYINKVQYVFVSIDPKNDTPKVLKEFAKKNYMDADNYTFLQGTESGVREFANVLAVKYKEISPLDFSHSNIISVFNPKGELIHQQEGLGVDNKETIANIIGIAKNDF
ncbi:SCO1 protein [Polaribacter huanghezhanensis]|uniref:SCO family protein n=1 Tax=Polaribacter huanghezhanensis TaxID=1354726 RepID=UPI002649AD24|nr:SCO family protein [Polaribacter huanghezhanensis]WKD86584.1 SCO1 protein [Polaribacter huanghezhanensis]